MIQQLYRSVLLRPSPSNEIIRLVYRGEYNGPIHRMWPEHRTIVDDPEVLLLYISDKFLLRINKKFQFLLTTKTTYTVVLSG